MLNPQTLTVEEVPWLVPDDDNDDSYHTSVELSFFESSPSRTRMQEQAAGGVKTGPVTGHHVPVRPLELKRRQQYTRDERTMTSLFPVVSRSVSDNAIPQRQCQRPPPRASVTPRSPSIMTRSSSSHFVRLPATDSTPAFTPLNIGPNPMASHFMPSQLPEQERSWHKRIPPSLDASVHFPLRSTSAPPSHVSPTERHLGLGQFYEDVQYLGFSPASVGSPSDSDSGMSRIGAEYHVGDAWDEAIAPMTPSRAGAKALQVLGACTTSSKSGRNPFKKTKKDCYRPLPNAVFQELDAFFGLPVTNARPGSKRGQPNKCTTRPTVDSYGQLWEDETEREEFSSLLTDHLVENDNKTVHSKLQAAGSTVLLSPIRLHSKKSMEALRDEREYRSSTSDDEWPDRGKLFTNRVDSLRQGVVSTADDDEDVFGRLAPLSKTAHGIFTSNNKTKERIIYNRQQSHPPPSTMSFLQNDPYAGTQRRHTSPRSQSVAMKRKDPPPPLTLDHRSPSAVKQVMIEQIVSGRPRLSSFQVPVRKSSRCPAVVHSTGEIPYTPFSAPRPAPAPPGAPLAPRRVPPNSYTNNNRPTCQDSSPKTPLTPSPEQPPASQFLTRIRSNPDDQPEAKPLLTQGISFFEDSPSPDHTHFRFAPSKAAMRGVSGRIRKAVRI